MFFSLIINAFVDKGYTKAHAFRQPEMCMNECETAPDLQHEPKTRG
ncbi:hypothetical protein ACKLNO_08875 [Neisseriaceae bacterium B1]